MGRRYGVLALVLVLTGVLVGGCRAERKAAGQLAAPHTAVAPRTTIAPETTTVPATEPTATAETEPPEEPAGQPVAADPAAPETVALSPAIAVIATGLQGLPLDDFLEASYTQLLLRDPEGLTRLGIAGTLGLRNDQLNDLSESYVRETQELETAILSLLQTYDRAGLTPDQQVSYDVYAWYLDDLVRGHAFTYYDYPVHHFLGSYHDHLTRLLTEIHPIDMRQDAEDYVARLSQVDDQVAQLLEGLRRREEIGVIPPEFIVEMTTSQMRGYLGGTQPTSIRGDALPVYTVFRDKLGELDGLSAEERRDLEEEALAEIEGSFIPAYVELLDYLDYLETIATGDAGVWKFPRGDEYYAYILRNQTSTDLTPEEVHALGLAEVARIQAEMRQVFNELGYPQGESLGELLERAERDAGYYETGTQTKNARLISAYEAMIDEMDGRLGEVFDVRPNAQVAVVGGPMGGYYVPGSTDGSRPGAFHVGTENYRVSKLSMGSLTYHEAIPGHHFQIALAQELDLPTFRNDVFFNGYGEGWALYAERLAWEMGLYDDDPYGNLGRLDYELLRAVRLVVDTGIHTLAWTREEANAAMAEAFGAPPGTTFYEVDRYIVRPAQATGYKVGMLKILELRQMAMDRLGDQFDLKEFHNVVVGNGSMPLEILERLVVDYVNGKLAGLAQAPPAGDGEVDGWAVLAEKDDYSDVDMGDLPVDYIGVVQMRRRLEDSGWGPTQIHDLREFDREMLQTDLDWLAAQADEDDVVLVYVAAHGSYLRDVLEWDDFFAADWEQIPSQRRLLIVDACQAANYTGVITDDPAPFLSLAAVDGDEYAWSGLEEEGLPIIGGVFTHYLAAAFGEPEADTDGDGFVSVQEAALLAEEQQRTYMHEVVFAVPEFVEMYRDIGVSPDQDPTFPDVVMDDAIGEPLYLALDAYR
jgi:uncharacterized protein (DUF885 family)